MRWMLLSIFVFFFVGLPLYYLNSVVMPDLQSLKQVYGNAGATASAVASQSAPNNR